MSSRDRRGGERVPERIWVAPLDGSTEPRHSRPASAGRLAALVSRRALARLRLQPRRRRKAKGQIYVIPAEGGEARKLTDSRRGSTVTWSPDSTRIAFTPASATRPTRRRRIEADAAAIHTRLLQARQRRLDRRPPHARLRRRRRERRGEAGHRRRLRGRRRLVGRRHAPPLRRDPRRALGRGVHRALPPSTPRAASRRS